jgi:DNA polymerase III delta prime subunit
MLFKDIIGQSEVKHHLADMVQQNRLSHALLFLAKEGSGGLPLALAFTQYLVCPKTSLKSCSQNPFSNQRNFCWLSPGFKNNDLMRKSNHKHCKSLIIRNWKRNLLENRIRHGKVL